MRTQTSSTKNTVPSQLGANVLRLHTAPSRYRLASKRGGPICGVCAGAVHLLTCECCSVTHSNASVHPHAATCKRTRPSPLRKLISHRDTLARPQHGIRRRHRQSSSSSSSSNRRGHETLFGLCLPCAPQLRRRRPWQCSTPPAIFIGSGGRR